MRVLFALVLMAMSFEAFANNYIIPNYYRARREANQLAAIGWSTRKEVNATLGHKQQGTEVNGTSSNDVTTTALSPSVFYRLSDQWNFETSLTYEMSEESDDTPPIDEDSNTLRGIHLGGGYRFSQLPAVISATFTQSRTDIEDGTSGDKSHIRFEMASVGYGHRLDNDVYVGGGLIGAWFNDLLPEDEPNWAYLVGVGKVFDPGERPGAAAEAILMFTNNEHSQDYTAGIRVLMNRALIQIYGEFGYGITQGEDKGSEYGLEVGFDHEMNAYYLNPEMSFDVDSDDNGTTETETLAISLEVGYRLRPVQAFLRLAYKTEDTESGASNEEETETGFLVGGSYFF